MNTLYIIAVPIGNERDIAMNAIEKLQQADLIIGEEYKETSKLLKLNGIDREFELLNELLRRELAAHRPQLDAPDDDT